MGWKAVGFVALGAAAVLGAEWLMGSAVVDSLQRNKATNNGYTIRLVTLPTLAGYNQPVGVSLSYNGQPVQDAVIDITVVKSGGTEQGQVVTDKNGIALLNLLSYQAQSLLLSASYAPNGQTVVTDVMTVTFKSSAGSKG